MPLSQDDERFLLEVHKKLADQPLEPGSPFYEPIHKTLDDVDPVWMMQRNIIFNEIQSLQLFSGFRGAGKTTELLRLKQDLERKGYFVLYADALDYVNPAEPIDISDLLMVLAGSFSDALADKIGTDVGRVSFWDRMTNFLTNTEISIPRMEGRLELSSPGREVLGGLRAGLNLKAELKTGSSFRQNLQKFLASQLADLVARVDLFFEDGVKTIRESAGTETQVVFIFDQLEQIRGTFQTWESVIQSIELLFSTHLDKLRLPYVHAVYAVPPWLRFLLPPEAPMTMLPTVHLWNNDAPRTVFEAGLVAFRALVHRRIDVTDTARLFGPAGARAGGPVDRVIEASGGYVRDLLRLMQEIVKRASALPVAERVVDTVINAARRDLLQLIALDDARWLRDIGQERNAALRSIDERSVERLSNFLDTHRVLYFVNDSAWYDIHPLIRDEVDRMVAADAARAGP
jgi:hypothetical protein